MADWRSAYPEAVDLAFGPYAKYGVLIKDYRNAKMTYEPSEMVGAQRIRHHGLFRGEENSICTSHVERLNGTQPLFLKRLNRLTLCFSRSYVTWKRLSPCLRPTTISSGGPGSRARRARNAPQPL